MLSFLSSFIPSGLLFEISPVDGVLQGVVGACGVTVLCNLLRTHIFIEEKRIGIDNVSEGKPRTSDRGWVPEAFQFWILTGILAVVGSRVTSLVVLEFSLRAISAQITTGMDSPDGYIEKLLVQCQFSVGCALSCSLNFLHKEAPHRWWSLLLASVLSWYLAKQTSRLCQHVKSLLHLHSSQNYCGICIGLLNCGSSIVSYLCCLLILIFTVAVIAALTSIHQQFSSATEAIRFWTPLVICYILLVMYMQEDQQRQPGSQTALQAVSVRLGGLLLLMLIVGQWADMLHIIICFLGEAICLLPTEDILNAIENFSADSEGNHAPRRDRKHFKHTKDQ